MLSSKPARPIGPTTSCSPTSLSALPNIGFAGDAVAIAVQMGTIARFARTYRRSACGAGSIAMRIGPSVTAFLCGAIRFVAIVRHERPAPKGSDEQCSGSQFGSKPSLLALAPLRRLVSAFTEGHGQEGLLERHGAA